MKVLYFDCFSGISGDMVIGALMDLGVEEEVFRRELGKLKLSGYDFIIKKIVKNSIAVTDFKVVLEQDICAKYDKAHEHLDCGNVDGQKEHQHFDENSSCIDELQHSNHHDHHHSHHDHHHNDDHSNTHNHARNLKDIEELIDSSDLSDKVKEFSKKVFSEIAFAEAKVHNMAVEEVHFHEVGAVDSIVDIVGTAICLDLLEIEKVYSSPLHDGTGFIECQHGRLPVPVPAVMEMLTNGKIPYIVEDINTELVTPTGMGIIKCLAHSFGNIPKMQITKVGYGGGKRDTGRLNALRCIMGTMKETSNTDEIVVLKTNIDDMNPEILGFVMDKLFEVGALDVYYTPVYMKKNRPAIELTVLCDEDKEQFIVDIILKETTTLGIRKTLTQRYKMDRETVKVNTKYGEVRVKVSKYGEFKKYSPEYEDLREISRSKDIPLWKVYNAVCEKGI